MTGKVCHRPMLTYFVSFWLNGETLISGLRRKGIILQALMWAVTSLWPQKGAFGSQNYSATAKLMLISDQTRDLLKVILKAGTYVSLSKLLVYIWDLESIDCQQSLHVMIYVRVIERE